MSSTSLRKNVSFFIFLGVMSQYYWIAYADIVINFLICAAEYPQKSA